LCTGHDSYSHTIGDADSDTNAYSYCDCDGNGNGNAAAYANTEAAFHSGTTPVTFIQFNSG
jgi:hypothetical protein